jgi:hypothetical protein
MATLLRSEVSTGVLSVNHGVSGPRYRCPPPTDQIRRQDEQGTGACGPQILSAFVKQRTCPHLIPLMPGFQDITGIFLEESAKFGPRSLRNNHANHAIFLRVMIHLMAHMAHNGTYLPAGLTYRGLQNNHHPPEDTQLSHGGECCLIWVPLLEDHLLDTIIRSR